MTRHTVPPQPADDWLSRAGTPDGREDPDAGLVVIALMVCTVVGMVVGFAGGLLVQWAAG